MAYLIFISSIYLFAFTDSNKVAASSNRNSVEIKDSKVAEQQNIESIKVQEQQKIETSLVTSNNIEKDPPPSVNPEFIAPVETPINPNYSVFFKDDAFLGDSISEGLSYYGYLEDTGVIAGKGLSITKGIDESDKIIALRPKRVFILFGINDIDDRTPSSWLVGQYTSLVVKLKTKLPDSKIYVMSILPVLEGVVENTHINNAHIIECNKGLIQMTNQENVNYVNLGSLLNESNKYLYEGDGIHLKPDFYPLWLNYLENIS